MSVCVQGGGVAAAAPPKAVAKKKFASKMRSIVSAVKTAQRLEVRQGRRERLLQDCSVA